MALVLGVLSVVAAACGGPADGEEGGDCIHISSWLGGTYSCHDGLNCYTDHVCRKLPVPVRPSGICSIGKCAPSLICNVSWCEPEHVNGIGEQCAVDANCLPGQVCLEGSVHCGLAPSACTAGVCSKPTHIPAEAVDASDAGGEAAD